MRIKGDRITTGKACNSVDDDGPMFPPFDTFLRIKGAWAIIGNADTQPINYFFL